MAISSSIVRYTDFYRSGKTARRLQTALQITFNRILPASSSVQTPIQAGPDGTVHPEIYLQRGQKIIDRVIDPAGKELIRSAFLLAWEGHSGQFRKSGEPYIDHPLAVAETVFAWGLGPEKIAAALCHDLVEDRGKVSGERVTSAFIYDRLGLAVAALVDGVTELGKEDKFKGEKPAALDIYKKWLEYGARDIGTILVKLADRLHNMRTLAYVKEELRKKKADETLKVYARIADILGMWELKRELEDLSFQYLEPDEFRRIKTRRDEIVKESRGKAGGFINEINEKLFRYGSTAKAVQETRFIYELKQRMEKRDLSLENFSPADIWRANIVVPKEADCYRVLGEIHGLYPPEQTEIHDYIAEPRANGHRFLTTYVKVKGFGRLLVQIRDREMQANYRIGILSKANGASPKLWLNALKEHLAGEGVTADDFYGTLDALSYSIVVYTEKGARIELPFGYTALDFARRVHTEILLRAEEAVIDGRPMPLSTVLQDGNMVYIVKNKEAVPSLEWIRWVRSPEALLTLRDYFANQAGDVLGPAYDLLDQETMRYYLPAKELMETELFRRFVVDLKKFKSMDEFLYQIGSGMVNVEKMLTEFMEMHRKIAKTTVGRLRSYAVMIYAENRQGLLEDITRPLKEICLDLEMGYWRKYREGGEEKAEVLLSVECVPGIVGVISQLQVQTIAKIHKEVAQVVTASPDAIERITRQLGKIRI